MPLSFAAGSRQIAVPCKRRRQVHGSCVSRDGDGVLLIGPPGSGKSDLRCACCRHGFDAGRRRPGGHRRRHVAAPPAALSGLLEVRGLGIVRLPSAPNARLALVVELGPTPERLPAPARHPEPGPADGPHRPGRRLRAGARRPGAGLRARPRQPGRRGLRGMSAAPSAHCASCWSPACPARGKASILRALEDLGYEAVDNPPLTMLEDMVARGRAQPGGRRRRPHPRLRRRRGAGGAGAAARPTRGCAPSWSSPGPTRPPCCAATPKPAAAIRWRRRAAVADGIAAEEALTAPLRDSADLVIDTSDLPLPELRRLIERHFGGRATGETPAGGVADFLRLFARACRGKQIWYSMHAFCGIRTTTPYCGPGRDWIRRSAPTSRPIPDYAAFFDKLTGLVELLLPRFVQEGKKYATITIGCTGGRHRSVYLVETLAAHLASRIAADQATGGPGAGWRLHVTHRELAREGHETGVS